MRLILGIVGLLVFVAAYVTGIELYSGSGMGHPHQIAEGRSAADGTTVTIDVEDVSSNNSVLTVNLAVVPGPALLDPLTGFLKEDLSVAVTSAVTPTKRTWSKGMLPGVFPVSLTVSGDVSDWPFDDYRSGPVMVDLFRGSAPVPESTAATFFDRLPGWKVTVRDAGKSDVPAPYRVEIQRSPSTVAFAVVLISVLITLAGLALFVAVQTVRDRRKFQPPMTTWYAAMLFAVIPLRNALPDSPPFGAWVDVTIVLWVIVALVFSMTLYISCWWRHLKPDNPADTVKPA